MIVDVSAEKENNHDIGLFGISGPEMHYEEDTLENKGRSRKRLNEYMVATTTCANLKDKVHNHH